MITVREWEKLKAQVDRLREEASQSEGALAQLMKTLKAVHNCDTLEEAAKKLADLTRKQANAEKAFGEALAAFEDKWGDALQ